MALSDILNIAGSGMNAQVVRMNTTASNLANAGVVSTTEDGAFRALVDLSLKQSYLRSPGTLHRVECV